MSDEALSHEERRVREYMAGQGPKGEAIKHIEKVASYSSFGRTHDVWDVHMTKDRWWVITEPTNLYRQRDFKYMDMAFTFHLGLAQRLAMRNEPAVDDDERERLEPSWRRWKQAAGALDRAREAEDFQAVGVRLRESLVSFAQDTGRADMVPKGQDPPKASDFVHWSELIADWASPGSSGDRIRGHLKAVSKSTWELVAWLTHAKNATRTDGVIAVEAVQHTLGQYGMAIMRREHGEPDRCPKCFSYRLTEDYRPELGEERASVTRCEACGWEVETKLLAAFEAGEQAARSKAAKGKR